MDSEQDTIDFAALLLELINRASTTTSYKYALLLALLELCQENVGRRDGPVGSVTTRQLGERVTALYWCQTAPYSGSSATMLRQIGGGKRSIPDLIREARAFSNASSLSRFRQLHPEAFEQLVDEVELILIRYPIPLLQRIGGSTQMLLFDPSPWEQLSLPAVRAYQKGLRAGRPSTGSFDNRLLLLPRVEQRFARLAELFRPIIQREWARFVAQRNGLEASQLESFLFGWTREDVSECRPWLHDLQQGRCFYCDERLNSKSEIDHFLPWSRCADNGIHNLVLADQSCNRDKSDRLASPAHILRWRQRSQESSGALASIAQQAHVACEPDRSVRLACALYSRTSKPFPVWQARRSLQHVSAQECLAALLFQRASPLPTC